LEEKIQKSTARKEEIKRAMEKIGREIVWIEMRKGRK
jgi:hypothetical protein